MDFKELIKELYRRLNVAFRVGYIEQDAFNVGMQLIGIMAAGKTCNFIFTWNDLLQRPVTQGSRLVANIAPTTHFALYGALQQLERHLGIVTHVSREEMIAHIEECREEGEYFNFTGMPGVDSYVIMPDTQVLCIYESWVGDNLDEYVEEYLAQFEGDVRVSALPRWLNVGHV